MSRTYVLIGILLLLPVLAGAATLKVPSPQYPTIQSGIDSAAHGDTVLVADGTYYERLRFWGTNALVASEYILDRDTSHILNTIIDADTAILGPDLVASVVVFVDGEDSRAGLVGLTIQNGTGVWHGVGQYWGAGIYCDSASPTIKNCLLRQNHAGGYGGGIYIRGTSSPIINQCEFSENSAALTGSGIGCKPGTTPSITDCLFHSNVGPVAYLLGSVGTIENCSFIDNIDGAIDAGAGPGKSQTYINCIFRDNGGVGVSCSGEGSYRFDRCEFVGNRGYFGGGLKSNDSDLELYNCLFANNTARIGGAFWHSEGSMLIENCTFVGNVSESPSLQSSSQTDTLVIRSSIIAFNDAPEALWCYPSYVPPVIHGTNIYGNSGAGWADCIADQADRNNNFSADPLFCDTSSGDYHLAENSSCSPEHSSTGGLIGVLDVGCGPILQTIRVYADGTGDAPSIQTGIDMANIGDTILLADGRYSGEGNWDIRLGSKNIVLTSDNGPENTIIDIQGLGRGIICDSGEDSTTLVEGITITNGFCAAYDSLGGAGMLCYRSSPTIRNCVFIDNHAEGASVGGGLYIKESSPVIRDCEFLNNTAHSGAGAFSDSSSSSLVNCVIANNRAETSGGGIMNSGSLVGIENCTLVGNSAPIGAGLYSESNGQTIIENSIIAHSLVGSAIECELGSSPEILCSNIFDNAGGDWIGCIANLSETNGNFSAEPEFCDTSTGDFGLLAESPCASMNNTCGALIGARDVGCSNAIPAQYSLTQNYPNPFNSSTAIEYFVPQLVHVHLVVYNILGQEVVTLEDEMRLSGEHTVLWNGVNSHGRPVSTGVYFYRIKASDFVETKKMLLLK